MPIYLQVATNPGNQVVEGPVTDPGFEKSFYAESWSYMNHQDVLRVSKVFDDKGPWFQGAAAVGRLMTVTLTVTKGAGGPGSTFGVTLSDAIITNATVTGTGDAVPMQLLEFSYTKVSWAYKKGPDGDTVTPADLQRAAVVWQVDVDTH